MRQPSLFRRPLALAASLLQRLRGPASPPAAAPSPRTSPLDRSRLYAIGDVHGCADLLGTLIEAIALDARQAKAEPCLVFLGDIVDRGPDSCGALRLVGEALARWPASRLILGNHDDALLSFFAGDSLGGASTKSWPRQGGRETLMSYGADPDDPKGARRLLRERYGDHHRLLAEASLIEIGEEFAFVHAGVRPDRAMDAQTRHDCLTIRARFMNHVGRLDRVVVHGHTPQRPARAVSTENRVSVDTGACFSGVLTALVIDRPARRLGMIATGPGGSIVHGSPDRLDRGLGTVADRFGEAFAASQAAPALATSASSPDS